jgi:hypothetical protein
MTDATMLLLLLLLLVLLRGSACNRSCDALLQGAWTTVRVPAEMKLDRHDCRDNSDHGACDVVGHSLRKPLFYFILFFLRFCCFLRIFLSFFV